MLLIVAFVLGIILGIVAVAQAFSANFLFGLLILAIETVIIILVPSYVAVFLNFIIVVWALKAK